MIKQLGQDPYEERVNCKASKTSIRGKSYFRVDVQFETQIISKALYESLDTAMLQRIEARPLHFTFANVQANGGVLLLLNAILQIANVGGSVGVQFGSQSEGYNLSIFCIFDPSQEPVLGRKKAAKDMQSWTTELLNYAAADSRDETGSLLTHVEQDIWIWTVH